MSEEYFFNRVPHEVPLVHTKNRKICTQLPAPESLEIIERHMKYEPWSMNNQLWIIWDKAVDYQIFDKWGNIWIDFSSGIFVTNAGHGNPQMLEALQKNNQLLEQLVKNQSNWKLAIRQGLMTGFGTLVGATLLVSVLVKILKPLEKLDVLKRALERIAGELERKPVR